MWTPLKKDRIVQLLIINTMTKQFSFSSSAIDDLIMNGDQVQITFTGGREYTYKAVNPTAFETALQGEISDPDGSVGRFVNRAIRSEDLVTV